MVVVVRALAERAVLSLTTFPSAVDWYKVAAITLGTTSTAGAVAAGTGFIDPRQDWDPPSRCVSSTLKPMSALIVPSLLEEVFWRGTLLPPPSSSYYSSTAGTIPWSICACGVLVLHVLSHPVAASSVWPRGRNIFGDPRFLVLATIVLGGATASFWASGGSAWAAAITHGVPVALWRDFFGGEAKLMLMGQHQQQQDYRTLGFEDADNNSSPSRTASSSKQRREE